MNRSALVALLLLAAPAAADPRSDFHRLLEEHWNWWLSENPVAATTLGVRDHDARLNELTLARMDQSAAAAQRFAERLAAIDTAALEGQDRISADVLARMLARQVEANGFPARARLFTNREGFHTSFATLGERMPFFTKADYESYVARLEAFPKQMDGAIATTKIAADTGWALPCVVLDNFAPTVRAVAAPVPQSRFWRPFATRPATISEAEWKTLAARARTAIEKGVNPAYLRFADRFEKDYAPRCNREVGISAVPGGRDYYVWRVKEQTTTDLTPDEVHELGLSEVARIRAEMEEVARRAGFPSREAYVEHLRTDPRYYAKTPQELMAAASYWAKIADGWMPRLFGRLPRLPYTLQEIPAETAPYTTTAYYQPGAAAAGRAGVYFVNTSKLNERPLFELPALTIHEAVPGHHHQITLAQELDLPPFRRHAARFIAFSEGWGLYSERLGIEMGVYEEPANDMGRLSYEMWRATRLVVDTGMHWKGWSKEEAVQYMLDNTALSAANIDAEVNRYIAWPGQALAYKVGELRIRQLRTEAETALGPRFDLRAFHDTVLENGAVPLDVMEAHVRAWIAREQGAR
ncbi:MAG: DUF885 domain-containing protein [Sphingomonadaceae bacterium]